MNYSKSTPITIADIAETLGLSKSTVSRVLSGTGRIGAETRKRVLEYAKELGLCYNPGPWVLAFFHEVGHSETLLDDSLDEFWEAYFDRQDIMTISDYVRHPIESAATEWAVNYINENIEEVKQMVKDIDAVMGSRVAEMSEEEMIKAFVRSE